MRGTEALPTNEDALAAELALTRCEDEAVIAQASASLAVAYEQRTLALIQFAAQVEKDEPTRAEMFRSMAARRLKDYGPSEA